MIVVNFKAYTQTSDSHALSLAQICQEVAQETGVRIIVAPSSLDIQEICTQVSIEVYAQHVDPIEPGAHTGWVSAASLREKGVFGTLLNHAEHRLDFPELTKSVGYAKEEGLGVIICADTVEYAKQLLPLFPNEIALEIPELIAGNVPITKADPEIIKRAVALIGPGKMLVGSGIKSADDVKAALDFGAKGIILASAVDLAKDSRKELLSLAKAFL